MCRATKCRVCGKTSWAGCGQHVAEVRRSVAASEWCNGKHPQHEIAEAQSARGFLARLFGR